jgi:hypothetical protein
MAVVGQFNFSRGEISPYLKGRVNEEVYKNGLDVATNCFVDTRGPIVRRNGFRFVKEVKDSTKKVRLIPYNYLSEQGYMLEFGHQYIRFYYSGGQVLSGGSPYEVATTYTQDEIDDIQYVQIGTVLYLFHGSHYPAKLVRSDTTSWTLSNISSYPPPTDEYGETIPYTITPGATTGSGVTFTAGSATFLAYDVGRQIVNLTGAGRAAITSVTSSTQAVCDILEAFPSTSAISANGTKLDLSPIGTFTPSGRTLGSIITITSGAAAFKSYHLGMYIRINNGKCLITEVSSSTIVKAEVQKTLSSTDASISATLEQPSWSSTQGYPAVVGSNQQRLIAASTSSEPNKIWFSQSSDFENFGEGVNDADSISVNSTVNSTVSWLGGLRDTITGGVGGESSIGTGGSGPLTPSNVGEVIRTREGSGGQIPIILEGELLYLKGTKNRILTMSYDYVSDSYGSQEISLPFSHLLKDGAKRMSRARYPYPMILITLDSGDLIAMTYSKNPQVLGATKITTDGEFEDAQVIVNGLKEDIYVIVKRNINGTEKRYIEILDSGTGEDETDGFSDSYLVYSEPKTITGITKANPAVVTCNSHGFSNGDVIKIKNVEGMTEVNEYTYTVANKTTNTFELSGVNSTSYTTYTSGGEAHLIVSAVSGLGHLEGKEVQVKIDGSEASNQTVSSGSINLDVDGAEVVIGLPYETVVSGMLQEQGGVNILQGQLVRFTKPQARVYKSTIPLLNGQFKPSRTTADIMDSPVPLYTGDIEYGNIGWDTNTNLSFSTSSPYPLVLLAMFGNSEAKIK